MATYVLVHGGWAGGWQWRAIAGVLQAAGHEVHRPTLTGLGERVHLSSPDITMETHILDIRNLIKFEMLRDIILVGYSYSGSVITGVAECIPELISRLIYIDGVVPENGQSIVDILGPDLTTAMEQAARSYNGSAIPYYLPEEPMATPLPLKPFYYLFVVQNPLAATLPRTYIHCTKIENPIDPVLIPIRQKAQQLRSDPTWTHRELAAYHGDMWLTHPQQAAELLLEFAT